MINYEASTILQLKGLESETYAFLICCSRFVFYRIIMDVSLASLDNIRFGKRSFSFAAPSIYNKLSANITQIPPPP